MLSFVVTICLVGRANRTTHCLWASIQVFYWRNNLWVAFVSHWPNAIPWLKVAQKMCMKNTRNSISATEAAAAGWSDSFGSHVA